MVAVRSDILPLQMELAEFGCVRKNLTIEFWQECCEIAGEKFALANDGAQDIGRYDFIKDISRLEHFISNEPLSSGYAALLTNDDLYWRESRRGINSADFFLHDGRILTRGQLLAWHEKTGEGTKKNRMQSFTLNTERKLVWADYSSLPGAAYGTFRYLCVKI